MASALRWWSGALVSTVALCGQAEVAVAPELCGRLEEVQGLRILRTWGSPAQRGLAHGRLLAAEIMTAMRLEFAARFQRRLPLLDQVRRALPRLIEYPAPVREELEALFAGLVQSGVSLDVEALDRAIDVTDLLVANALDVFGLMGCSGFTLWGEQVEGGGVLSGRNFDWPCTGPHLLEQTIVHVQHLPDGAAVATVTWPGYLGAVTGIDDEGVAVSLHVGSGRITLTPEPGSWPTAVAALEILRAARGGDAAGTLAMAEELLGYTSPPAGFLVRVVLPNAKAAGSPAGLFEIDSKKCVRALLAGPCVVTNHFQGRTDGSEASGDSVERHEAVSGCVDSCLRDGDHKVSVAEAWEALAKVQRGGGKRFGTLHSLVFRHEPWCFELRLGELHEGKIVAAPASSRRMSLPREALFPAVPPHLPPRAR